MSMVTEPVLATMWTDLSLNHLDDQAWLHTLAWRRSTNQQLVEAAKLGDVIAFGTALAENLIPEKGKRKKQAAKLARQLRVIWNSTETMTSESGLPSLESCLLEDAAQLPAMLFQNVEDSPSESTLVTALWILNLHGAQLDAESCTALWRWTLQHSQASLQTQGELDPEDGFDNLPTLEHRLLAAHTFQDLNGGHKILESITKLVRKSLDESVDSDGTIHAQWLKQLDSVLLCVARLNMFARLADFKLWSAKTESLLKQMFERVASAYYANSARSFSAETSVLSATQLDQVAELFGFEKESGLRELFTHWEKPKSKSKPINAWLLPEECHQSDWAEWACLRSTWVSPVDQCLVSYDAIIPQIDVVAKNVSLFRGDWKIHLSVNGNAIQWADEWSCACWYSDEEVSFVELQQEVKQVKVLRQVTLLRQENMLLIADAISTEEVCRLDYNLTLPLADDWHYEADSWTREAALQHNDLRVRAFPISSPQPRVENGDGKLNVAGNEFQIHQSSNASGMFVATLFDWSKSRAKKPVDWSRITVAENSEAVSPGHAAGYRIRIGKTQWMLYHSLKQPLFPRSVLGYHTGQETIFAKFEPDGEITNIVEVEAESR